MPNQLWLDVLKQLGEHHMVSTYEERLEQFRLREIERTRRAGLSAYVLNEDGSVLRISPDGKKDLIVVRLGRRHVQPVDHPGEPDMDEAARTYSFT